MTACRAGGRWRKSQAKVPRGSQAHSCDVQSLGWTLLSKRVEADVELRSMCRHLDATMPNAAISAEIG